MSESVNERLRSFARAVLERRGALVEWDDAATDGLAILPEKLAKKVGSEAVTLTHDAAADGQGQAKWAVNLATDFLDRAAELMDAEPSEAWLRLENLYLKKSAMDEPVARYFAWPNARVRVAGAVGVRLEYHYWHLHAAIESDERWEDLIAVTVNSATGARLEMPNPLTMPDVTESHWELAAEPTTELARRAAAGIAEARAAPFVGRLETRLARDRRRLKEYYDALLEENSPARSKTRDDPEKLEAKRRVVQLELRRKLLELDQRYALRTSLEPLTLVRLNIPALRVDLEVAKRSAKGTAQVYWNPLRKELEPLACRRCFSVMTAVHFNDEIEPLCASCAGA